MSENYKKLTHANVLLFLFVACNAKSPSSVPASEPPPVASPRDVAGALATELHRACPEAPASDAAARDRCAENLASSTLLRQHTGESVLWGAQKTAEDYDLSHSNKTLFNSLVHRRLYLSTFTFASTHTVVQDGPRWVLRIPVQFRGELDAGDYPYPFWHSAKKWQSYEQARELLFVFEDGKVTGVLRSQEQDPAKPHSERAFDGKWTWQSGRGPEPQVTLFSWLLTSGNPHTAELDHSYRDVEARLRAETCLSCHAPDNIKSANPLEMFTYPNQALSGRHDLVSVLERNSMPPASDQAAAGVADESQRAELLQLARKFADIGDRALAFEAAHDRPLER